MQKYTINLSYFCKNGSFSFFIKGYNTEKIIKNNLIVIVQHYNTNIVIIMNVFEINIVNNDKRIFFIFLNALLWI